MRARYFAVEEQYGEGHWAPIGINDQSTTKYDLSVNKTIDRWRSNTPICINYPARYYILCNPETGWTDRCARLGGKQGYGGTTARPVFDK